MHISNRSRSAATASATCNRRVFPNILRISIFMPASSSRVAHDQVRGTSAVSARMNILGFYFFGKQFACNKVTDGAVAVIAYFS